MRAILNNVHGFSAFTVLGHSRSRLFGPKIGNISLERRVLPLCDRITIKVRAYDKSSIAVFAESFSRLWIGFTGRFDRGLVVVNFLDYVTAHQPRFRSTARDRTFIILAILRLRVPPRSRNGGL